MLVMLKVLANANELAKDPIKDSRVHHDLCSCT